MNRRIHLTRYVSLVVAFGLTASVILMVKNRSSEVTVSFVNAEASHGEFPLYTKSERFAFAARNAGSAVASVQVVGIEDERGNWIPSLHVLGEVEAGQNTQLYLYLPHGSQPRNLRMRVLKEATTVQKTKVALEVLIDQISGRSSVKQAWFDKLRVPVCEFILSLGTNRMPSMLAPNNLH